MLFLIFNAWLIMAGAHGYTSNNIPTVAGDWTDYIDLSYAYSDDTLFFPGQREFHLSKDMTYNSTSKDRDFYYQSYSFCMGEHGGTHLDAPFHFSPTGWKVEEIPNERLLDIPAAIINVQAQVSEAPIPSAYVVTAKDIVKHEAEYGPIPKRGVVLIYTGWGSHWGDRNRYLGDRTKNGSLSFPGLSLNAVRWLYHERSVVGVGIDTASIDPGHSTRFEVHRFLAENQIFNLENVGNLHLTIRRASVIAPSNNKTPTTYEEHRRVPCTSYNLYVLPMKIVGGTGAPARVLAKCMRGPFNGVGVQDGGIGAMIIKVVAVAFATMMTSYFY